MECLSVNSLKLDCPAKLNLNLSVVGKRIDGMHEIKTRFQLINLFDEMVIRRTSNKFVSVETNLVPPIEDSNNIVFSAIKLLSDHIGKEIHCEVEIIKNIPLGGGLGGGSSNAAAALIGTNFLFKLGLSTEELMKLGEKLGADVPFFIFGKNAFASGIGQILEEESKQLDDKYLLLFPQIHSSTKELFSKWDNLNKSVQKSILTNEENSFLPIFLDQNQDIKITLNEKNDYAKLNIDDSQTIYDKKSDVEVKIYIDEKRRVFNNDVHYFDHPRFGVILHISEDT